ncbi:hypothetical protein COS81_00435 [candidate division WWE3 bacterium CG06_land_8_20_14_3_00_42_16]|uniref:Zinc-ribbon domain-containing protein n=4 Tax=Katanobacteria TaxID=422282 RepID=A0A2M7APT6_UNCKA|nr:MAG: hypothetical protein COS81_00435 [candidate division WWE3 bacterium CG06_land_8_20_14_3_00_42_16]PIZ42770.1 MAG: hypothetical protein COY34_02205 [candidate division WWE3 bacterium CG_4_10_14_0_2_um_filter_42_8]PJA37120.1 MAG: hypothetical protein CO181_04875 [candidate division WWE3 bacterium CG_4_9_14_3_um_filter_43_9]PJC68967.1 MAG: hypothetical protein CO015_02115 [candidate division WWE3 bacterium CG_4_8_14_3_um_filter_42_11]
MEVPLACPRCHTVVNPDDYFCANCGEKLKKPQFSLSHWKVITIYLVSFLLPPSGLYFGLKYLRQNDEKLKKVGKLAIVLTGVSLAITIIMTVLSIRLASEIIKSTTQDYLFNF